MHLLLQEAVEQQKLQSPVHPRQGVLEDASSQAGEESAVNTPSLSDPSNPAEARPEYASHICWDTLPSQTDQRQLPDGIIETGVKRFTF